MENQTIQPTPMHFFFGDEVQQRYFIYGANYKVRFFYENNFWDIREIDKKFYLFCNYEQYSLNPINLLSGKMYIINIMILKQTLQIKFDRNWRPYSYSYNKKLIRHDDKNGKNTMYEVIEVVTDSSGIH